MSAAPRAVLPNARQPSGKFSLELPDDVGERSRLREAGRLAARHKGLLIVLGSFIISAFFIPVMAPVPVSDDWIYTRSVQLLVQHHELKVMGLSVASLVFQVIWGSLFASILGMSFGALRIATFTLTVIGGAAFYGLCRELGISPGRAALGTAAYLFNPIAYMLAFTFMTDQYLISLMVIATFCFVRGLRPVPNASAWLITGSIVAGLAFLVRQVGASVIPSILLYLLISGRLRFNRDGLRLFLQVAAAPALIAIAYFIWLRTVNGVPFSQTWYPDAVKAAGLSGSYHMIRSLVFIEVMYAGLFALPLTLAVVPALWQALHRMTVAGWLSLLAVVAVVTAGLAAYHGTKTMPYIPHFLDVRGLGPHDLVHPDLPLVGGRFLIWATYICAGAAIVAAVLLCHKLGGWRTPNRSRAALVALVGAGQAVAVVFPSYLFINFYVPSLDRYVLPLLPFTIALLLWASRGLRIFTPPSWLAVLAVAAFAVLGTRDSLSFHQATWQLDKYANQIGIANTQLDGGATWDGYHLVDYNVPASVNDTGLGVGAYPIHTPNPPWWIALWAPETDSTYMVSASPLPGWQIIAREPYHAFFQQLEGRHPELLLLRRSDAKGSP